MGQRSSQYARNSTEEECEVIVGPSSFMTPRTVSLQGPYDSNSKKNLTRITILMAFSMMAGMVVAFVIAAAVWPRLAPGATESGPGGAVAGWGQVPKRLPALTILKSDALFNAAADGVVRLGQRSIHLKDTEFAKGGAHGRALLSSGMRQHMHGFLGNATGLSRMLSELELSEDEADAMVRLVENMFNPEIFEVGLESIHALIEGVVPGAVSGFLKGGSLDAIEESITDTVLGLLPHKDYIRKLAASIVPRALRDDPGQQATRKQVLESRFKFVMDGAARHTSNAGTTASMAPATSERRLLFDGTRIDWFLLGAPTISAALGILLTTLMGRLPGYHEKANDAMWAIEGAAMLGDCLANIGYPTNVVNFAPCIIDVLFFGAEAAFVFLKPDSSEFPVATSVCPSASEALKLTISTQTINNLGGAGPESNVDPVMRFPSVGQYHGQNINLVVSSGIQGTYDPLNNVDNGVWREGGACCTASINMGANGEFLLRIGFVNDADGPVTVDMVQWSFFDFYTNDPTVDFTSLTIGGFSSYFVPQTSKLTIVSNGDGTTTFTSNPVAHALNSVADPANLTEEQASIGVAFIFEHISMIEGVLNTGAAGGINVKMAGDVTGMCAHENDKTFAPTVQPTFSATASMS